MRYTESSPSTDLRRYVRCYWRMQGTGSGVAERIIPDGCPELVVNLGDPFLRTFDDGAVREQDVCIVVGQLRRALRTLPSGRVDLFGVRFQPSGLRAILGCSVGELADLDVPLSDVNRTVRRSLGDIIQRAPSHDWLASVDGLFEELILGQSVSRHARHSLSVEAIARVEREGVATVGALARSLAVSARSLERAFAEEIGIGPKEYLRIRRLQRVIRSIGGLQARPDWARLSAECGYCDQSHLVREFRSIAGIAPERYLRERSSLAGAFAGV